MATQVRECLSADPQEPGVPAILFIAFEADGQWSYRWQRQRGEHPRGHRGGGRAETLEAARRAAVEAAERAARVR